jgi:hypothetical protein
MAATTPRSAVTPKEYLGDLIGRQRREQAPARREEWVNMVSGGTSTPTAAKAKTPEPVNTVDLMEAVKAALAEALGTLPVQVRLATAARHYADDLRAGRVIR